MRLPWKHRWTLEDYLTPKRRRRLHHYLDPRCIWERIRFRLVVKLVGSRSVVANCEVYGIVEGEPGYRGYVFGNIIENVASQGGNWGIVFPGRADKWRRLRRWRRTLR